MIPVAVMGFTSFSRNIRRLRRTVITIKVGEVFEIVQKGGRIDSNARQALADEIMMRLAVLMPNEMRGHYKDKDIVFNLTRTVKA